VQVSAGTCTVPACYSWNQAVALTIAEAAACHVGIQRVPQKQQRKQSHHAPPKKKPERKIDNQEDAP